MDSWASRVPTSHFMTAAYAGPGSGSALDFDSLYREGAKVAPVYGPRDNGYRLISIKIYTMKLSDGSLQSFVGIVDITDRLNPYLPKLIPVTFVGEEFFPLKDGGRQYSFRIQSDYGEHEIIFMRAGTREGEGAALSSSAEELFRARADQAARGSIVRIGNALFYALGQGGARGSFLLFPKEYIDSREQIRDTRYLRPVAMADVSRVDADGVTVPVSGHPDLGLINGEPYHLERSGDAWRVEPGPGD